VTSVEDTPVEMKAPASVLPRTEKYLRNRPFLLVSLIRRPAKGVHTNQKGYTEVTGNLTTFEQPSLVDRVNDIHLRTSNVIIDVLNGKIVKNSFQTPDDEVVHHYLEKYREQVTEAMDVWLSHVAAKQAAKQAPADATYTYEPST
jgi:hypothetical protein